jgi:hypothetical protein
MIRKEIAIEKPSRKNINIRLEIPKVVLNCQIKVKAVCSILVTLERITSFVRAFFHGKTICFTAKFYLGILFDLK